MRKPADTSEERVALAVRLMGLLDASRPVSVTELAQKLDTPREYLYRLVRQLADRQLVKARWAKVIALENAPSEEIIRAALGYVKKRQLNRKVMSYALKGEGLTKRRCRMCNGSLPPSRYFHCTNCQDTLPDDELAPARGARWMHFD